MKVAIDLARTQAQRINLSLTDEIPESGNIRMSYSAGFPDDESKSFLITFELGLLSTEGFSLDVSYLALFGTSETIDEKFRNSMFPVVNAPAIAYPFLRSFVSNLTLNAGFEATLLPAVNFQELANRQGDDSTTGKQTPEITTE